MDLGFTGAIIREADVALAASQTFGLRGSPEVRMDAFTIPFSPRLSLLGKRLVFGLRLHADITELGLRGGVELDTLNEALLHSIENGCLGDMPKDFVQLEYGEFQLCWVC